MFWNVDDLYGLHCNEGVIVIVLCFNCLPIVGHFFKLFANFGSFDHVQCESDDKLQCLMFLCVTCCVLCPSKF